MILIQKVILNQKAILNRKAILNQKIKIHLNKNLTSQVVNFNHHQWKSQKKNKGNKEKIIIVFQTQFNGKIKI